LTQRLDPRGFRVHAIQPPRTFEQSHPWLWRFWLKVPHRGEMVIFDQSWYDRVMTRRVEKDIPEEAWRAAYSDIADFERMLADDGTAIVKFFFHISKKEQKKRFEKMEKDPLEAWRVSKADWARHKKYEDYLVAAEEMLERTEAEYAPWTIIEATSRWWARKKLFEVIIAALEQRLGKHAPKRDSSKQEEKRDADLRAAIDSMGGDQETF
jgi:polyphosphate kinase 2 (PPK2 family)